jgi:hypothetical protein
MVLVPNALTDVKRVSGLPFNAFFIQKAVALAAQHDDNRLIVFVRDRM